MMDFVQTWKHSKGLWQNFEFEEAIKLFKELSLLIETQDHFKQTLFLGDYLGILCDGGSFNKAIEISKKQ